MATPPSPSVDVLAGRRVLVTGGAGFIGSHLARRLLALEAQVVVLDDLSTGRVENLPSGVDFREASILDAAVLADATAGCDAVFHEAAMVSVPLSVREPSRCAEVNITGTFRVLEAARVAGVRRVVCASSSAVYGDEPALPSRETDRVDPRSPYAASKAAGEAFAAAFGRCYDISTVSLRYFNVFGPGQDPEGPYAAVIAAFAKALEAGIAVTIHGDGRQTRDFVPIENVVHANLLAAVCPRALEGEAINVGTGRRIDLLEVLEVMRDGRTMPEPMHEPERAGDVRDSTPDLTRARELLAYEPVVSFEEGIGRLFGAR